MRCAHSLGGFAGRAVWALLPALAPRGGPPHLVQQPLHAAAQHRGQQVHLGQQAAQTRLAGVLRQPRLGRQLQAEKGEWRRYQTDRGGASRGKGWQQLTQTE